MTTTPKTSAKKTSKISTRVPPYIKSFAKKHGIHEDSVLKMVAEVAFLKGDPATIQESDLLSFVLTAEKHGLDPFVREIYADVDEHGRYVPVVRIDGWNKIIQRQPDFGCVQFKFAEETTVAGAVKKCPIWVECEIYRKGYDKPTVAREYLDGNFDPQNQYWLKNAPRNLCRRAEIQAAKIAFGLGGIVAPEDVIRSASMHQDKAASANAAASKTVKTGVRPVTGGLQNAKTAITQAEEASIALTVPAEQVDVVAGTKQPELCLPDSGDGKPLFTD